MTVDYGSHDLTTTGDVGINTSSPSFKLDVNGTFSANSVNVNDAFTLPTSDGAQNQILVTDGSGNVAWSTLSSSGIDGSGTAGNIPKFSDSDTLTDSLISESADTVTISGNLAVSGTTTTINSTTVTVDDKNIELGSNSSPTDVTANGGGITLKGSTDKTIIWDSTNSNWTSSENFNIAAGKEFKINNVAISGAVLVEIVNGRLSLKEINPIPSGDQTAKTTIYFVPYKGNQIALYSGSAWVIHSFSALSLSLSGYAADTNFDIFIYDNSGTLTLESAAWTDDTTRATALTTQDGVYVKSGVTTRRYLGTIRTTPTTGQCEDSIYSRFVWNHYNQVKRYLRSGSTVQNSYATQTFRAWNDNTTVGELRHNYVLGLGLIVSADATGQTRHGYVDYAIDSTTVGVSPLVFNGSDTVDLTLTAGADLNVVAGYHYAQGLQRGVADPTSIFHSMIINTNFQG